MREKITDLNQTGQAMADYALILALVGIVAVVSLNLLGTAIRTSFGSVAGSLPGSVPGFTPASCPPSCGGSSNSSAS